MGFKKDYSFSIRKCESNKILLKYPSRIPIIVEKSKICTLKDIDKIKYLVPKELIMNQFIYEIRKRLLLKSSDSIFVLVNNQLCSSNALIADVYEDYADKDGFLYVTYTSENTFG